MKDFFVSYTGSDKNYAIWVAEVLENAGYTVIIQAWDFKAGDNLVSKINESLINSKKLVIILSENYLKSGWCEKEWTTKLNEQVAKGDRNIIPIKVENVNLEGLLNPIIYASIVDKSEQEAESIILDAVKEDKLRRSNGFPGYYNVEHIQIDIDYLVEKDKIIYTKTCHSRVVTDGLDRLQNNITWFPDESVKIESLTEGFRIELLDLKDSRLNYNVVFDRKYKKGEIIEVSVRATLTNAHKHFKNFVSTEIIVPIEELNIHLKLSDSSVNKYYTQKVCSSPMNVRTRRPVEHMLFGNSALWQVRNPEVSFEYKIFW